MGNSFKEQITDFEVKDTIDVFHNIIDITEEKIRELEENAVVIIQNSE